MPIYTTGPVPFRSGPQPYSKASDRTGDFDLQREAAIRSQAGGGVNASLFWITARTILALISGLSVWLTMMADGARMGESIAAALFTFWITLMFPLASVFVFLLMFSFPADKDDTFLRQLSELWGTR